MQNRGRFVLANAGSGRRRQCIGNFDYFLVATVVDLFVELLEEGVVLRVAAVATVTPHGLLLMQNRVIVVGTEVIVSMVLGEVHIVRWHAARAQAPCTVSAATT